MRLVSKHEQVIHSLVSTHDGKFNCYVLIVYALHTVEDRRSMWEELVRISAGCQQAGGVWRFSLSSVFRG